MTNYEKILQDLESVLGVAVTVHDELGIFSDRAGHSLIPGRNMHRHPYCFLGRERRDFNSNCCAHCVIEVNTRLRITRAPIETHCWKGVREIVVPVFRGELRCMTLYAGAFRLESDECPLTGRACRKLYRELRVAQPGELERIARMLTTAGYGLLAMAEEAAAPRDEAAADRRGRIERFLYRNAHRPDCSLARLAKHLSLSVSRTGHLVRECCCATFHQLLALERIRRVKTLLLSGDTPLADIGEAAGIPDESYLCRLFRKYEGVSPGEFRRRKR